MVARSWGSWEDRGVTANGYRAYIWHDDNALELDSGDGLTTLNILETTELYTFNEPYGM